MKHLFKPLSLTTAIALALTGCGGSDDNNSSANNATTSTKAGISALTTGKLLSPTETTVNLSAEELKTLVNNVEPQFMQNYSQPVCGVRVEYIHYDTVDVKGNPTDATGAVYIPTGDDPKCTGNRPVVLHAHGTATQQNHNYTQFQGNEASRYATIVAGTFTGQGYIVITPNYAGYDKSKLAYHPYLNAKQQSHEMADALKAGREVIKQVNATTKVADNGKLFLTGFSQGGHVTMATMRYFEQLGESITASMPISGPYAMGAFGDVVFGAGNVMLGGTFFAPLMARNYQEQYGDIYSSPSEIFATTNPDETMNLLPNKEFTDMQLIANGKLPQTALFQKAPTGNPVLDSISPKDPTFEFGFDNSNYLIKNEYRLKYLADMQANPDWAMPYFQGNTSVIPVVATNPQHGLRKALKDNDLRSFVPNSPTVMCGGNQDPMVFFDVNSSLSYGLWSNLGKANPNTKIGFIDIDITNQTARNRDVYQSMGFNTVIDNSIKTTATAMQTGFANEVSAIANQAGAKVLAQGGSVTDAQMAGKRAVLQAYHGVVTPYCMGVAEKMFSQF